jgi:hypothetical protein
VDWGGFISAIAGAVVGGFGTYWVAGRAADQQERRAAARERGQAVAHLRAYLEEISPDYFGRLGWLGDDSVNCKAIAEAVTFAGERRITSWQRVLGSFDVTDDDVRQRIDSARNAIANLQAVTTQFIADGCGNAAMERMFVPPGPARRRR